MKRNHSIDAFRGIAIIGMVFFTLTLRLSRDLPNVLRHNSSGSIHLGDLVLPMFLFASGLSIAYFLNKKGMKKRKIFLRHVIGRFGILALVGISLSTFSANGFLEMDEVMLSAILFIACVALYRFDWRINLGIIFFISLSYLALIQLDKVSIFAGHYLGGYPAAFYYLPVMLTGLVMGKGIISEGLWCKSNKIITWSTFIFFLFFMIVTPLDKMTVTPSFVMLSILFSILVFSLVVMAISNFSSLKILQYIGKKPIRYWILMYVVLLIPLWFYVHIYDINIPLTIPWPIGVLISFGSMLLLFAIYRFIDFISISN